MAIVVATWDTIGPLACDAIKDFFATSHMPSYFSATKLVVIPKVPHLNKAIDFRPISCYDVFYKCVSKFLCKRLKEVLPYLINHSQGAFGTNREFLFNVLICQDLARGYTRKHISPRCILKFDLHKAFDSIS